MKKTKALDKLKLKGIAAFMEIILCDNDNVFLKEHALILLNEELRSCIKELENEEENRYLE